MNWSDYPKRVSATIKNETPILSEHRRKMKPKVKLARDENGWIVAEVPELPGCVSQGRTEAEALANIEEAIAA